MSSYYISAAWHLITPQKIVSVKRRLQVANFEHVKSARILILGFDNWFTKPNLGDGTDWVLISFLATARRSILDLVGLYVCLSR